MKKNKPWDAKIKMYITKKGRKYLKMYLNGKRTSAIHLYNLHDKELNEMLMEALDWLNS